VAKKAKKTVKKVKKATKKTTVKKAKKTTVKKTAVKKTAAKKTKKKKTTTKKTAPARKTRRKRKSTLTPAEIDHFRAMLLAKRAEIIGDVNSIESEALRKSRLDAAGDLSSMPIHMADIGTDNFEQEFALGLMDSERKLLVEINGALNRISNGAYGICEGTGQPIAKARLEAIPWARYCIEYATMVDKGTIIEGEKMYDEEEEELLQDSNELDDEDIDDYDYNGLDQEEAEEEI
jgi:DnaK suppressor protein